MVEGNGVYDDLLLTAQCIISGPAKIPGLCAWFKERGKVTFARRQGGFYHARIVSQTSFEKILRGNPHRSFAANFRCKTFWYATGATPIKATSPGAFIASPGSVGAEPVTAAHGSGYATLMAGMAIAGLFGIFGSITLDTPVMEAYSGVASANSRMSGGFPILLPGTNAVRWSGNISRVVIQPNWPCLLL
ncbi:MAG: hypothetical protein VB099_09895 [Candidatus Limiplasma sp.]|nr:hypothetical protein [Candidatus Limiplasma sp.]